MSIGARLREERQRLGLNQTEFAALAGASKRAQVNWEKDESSPTAQILVAFAQAGADVLYILTGKRMSVAFHDRLDWGAQDMLDNVEDTLRDPTAAAERQGTTVQATLETAKAALATIATSESREVNESARERADDLLRKHFDDQDAAGRRSQRYASLVKLRRDAERDLTDAVKAWDMTFPDGLHQQLVTLVVNYHIEMEDMLPLIAEIVRPLSRLRQLDVRG